jgi:glycosyltransferase involved in cell wall biosynthesis
MTQNPSARRDGPAAVPGADLAPAVSVIVPVYDEEDAITAVTRELLSRMHGLGLSFELLVIDDGSADRTSLRLEEIARDDTRLKLVRFRRNFGQTAALMAGFDLSRGDIIITLDGDGQNDPADIPRLLTTFNEGYDVVSGWRQSRHDGMPRVLLSRVANRLISAMTGVRLNDYGCTLKVYRRSVLEGVRLYGELHRFIPIFAHLQGARVTELPVNHRPRTTGETKYGLDRTFKVLLDLMLVMFLERVATRPMHLFGGIALVSLGGALAAGIAAIWIKIAYGGAFISTPLPLLVVMLTVLGIVCLLSGLLAEMILRTYYESQGKKPYVIREVRNFGDE